MGETVAHRAHPDPQQGEGRGAISKSLPIDASHTDQAIEFVLRADRYETNYWLLGLLLGAATAVLGFVLAVHGIVFLGGWSAAALGAGPWLSDAALGSGLVLIGSSILWFIYKFIVSEEVLSDIRLVSRRTFNHGLRNRVIAPKHVLKDAGIIESPQSINAANRKLRSQYAASMLGLIFGVSGGALGAVLALHGFLGLASWFAQGSGGRIVEAALGITLFIAGPFVVRATPLRLNWVGRTDSLRRTQGAVV